MFCEYCGTQNYSDAKYCSKCGQKLSPKKEKTLRKGFIIAAVCLLVIGIGVGMLIPRIAALGGKSGNGRENPDVAKPGQVQSSDPAEDNSVKGQNEPQSGSEKPNMFVGMFQDYEPDANYISALRNKYPKNQERYSDRAFLPYVNEILTLYLADLEDAGFDFGVIERVDLCSESSYVVELTENGDSQIQVLFTISAYDPKAATMVSLGCDTDYQDLDRFNRNLEAMWIAYNTTLNVRLAARGNVDVMQDAEYSVSDQYGVMLRGQYDGLGYVQATGDSETYLTISPDLTLPFFDGMEQSDSPAQESGLQQPSAAWKENLLIEDPLDVMTQHRDKIVSVEFLDTLKGVPEKPWSLGQLGVRENVLGWIDWENGRGHAYIAAEGGVNGRDACDGLFEECEALKEVRFNGVFHTDETKSMANMFYKCGALEEVDLENLNTSNATSMYQMFRECGSLESLDLSRMNTSRVETMYSMFSTCNSLKKLDLRSFDTSNVTNMGYMFSACTKLKKVDVSSFDTSEVYNMEGMFRWCNELEEYDFSNWDVSSVEKYSGFMNSGMKINGQKWENFFA